MVQGGKTMRYSGANWLELFLTEQPSAGSSIPSKGVCGDNTVLNYRVKTIRSGSQIEVEAVPIWSTAPGIIPAKKSPEAIRRANAENARKHFERKINTNFTDVDYRIDFTYANDFLPDFVQAKQDMENYLRRVKYACRKKGLPPPRYMGVSEGKRESSRQKRIHHHLVISCSLPRDELESIWKKGRVRAEHLQADRFGYTALARYMMKEPKGSKRYFCSRNLKEPIMTTSDTKLSLRKAERIALAVEENAPVIFGQLYKDCEYLDCKVKHSDFVSGVYIYARLRKNDQGNKRNQGKVYDRGKENTAEWLPAVGNTVPKENVRKDCVYKQGRGGCRSLHS
jgi:hypothetical protein